ncbi:MAG: transcription-repair coupling factor [Candidatus Omnitrophica bacterium]|nr:transcription-repair coupling factor [Candidatus Omnitrophota bacterium]HOX54883.1 transcription-repair coupling factor [Candidatus Omnitrophota bacterium]
MFKSLKLYVSQEIKIRTLQEELVDLGYKRLQAVSEEGDFSVRGGILDVFPVSFDCPLRIEFDMDKIASIYSFNVVNGRRIWEHRSAIILPKKTSRATKSLGFSEETPLNNFVDLEVGDYAVHSQHGIGRYLGIDKLQVQNKYQDHFVLEYDGGDKLYVPTDQLHLIQKYIGFEHRSPRLYKLGSQEWQRVKDRTAKGIKRLALDLLQIQAIRDSLPGIKFSSDTDWQKQFEKTFPFKETPDQEIAVTAVKHDMEEEKPMDRLICGDVGYGKTEVAMRAAFKAVMDNKQVAFLVPTTILAEQHYYNFSQRLKDFPVNVQMLSRFKTESQQREIIENVKNGSVDIVIGTHRLLSDDIKFRDLGLVIIDEEQRFGVEAKEKLKRLRLLVDVLTLTATPIPRTLYMAIMDAKDMSTINTPPQDRIPIKTFVAEYDDDLVKQAVTRELDRNGQVYVVNNHIQGIEKLKHRISGLINKANIAVAHGQMASHELESIMLDFIKGKIDVLVSTMIIQAGIDVPNANTLIVNHAESFGLADLHQLRGRVGRFNRQAYAYFLFPKTANLSPEAQKRLKAIEEYNELGSGFKIAFEDLQIRGAGNLLGTEQHGYISAVGFDLYCRLLKEAISDIKKG